MDNISEQGRIYVTLVSIYVPDLKDQTEFPIFRTFLKPNYQSMGQMQYFFLFARNVFSFHC